MAPLRGGLSEFDSEVRNLGCRSWILPAGECRNSGTRLQSVPSVCRHMLPLRKGLRPCLLLVYADEGKDAVGAILSRSSAGKT